MDILRERQFRLKKLKGRDRDISVDRRIILKQNWRLWTGINWFNIGFSAGPIMELRIP
jgi:hypothetical protein